MKASRGRGYRRGCNHAKIAESSRRSSLMHKPYCFTLAACLTLLPACGFADVDLTARLADPANLAQTGSFGFYAMDLTGTGKRTLVAVGDTILSGALDQAEVVTLGPSSSGGLLLRSTAQLPHNTFTRAVATSPPPNPLLLIAGDGVEDSHFFSGIEVYAGWPLQRAFTSAIYSPNGVSAAALTRAASASDFDVALGGYSQISLWSSKAVAPTWSAPSGSITAMATLPAAGVNPARLIAAGAQLELRDLTDGSVLASAPLNGGRRILIGNVAGNSDPEIVVVGNGAGIAVFSSNPLGLLWQDTSKDYVDADLYDRNNNGLLDIVLTDYEQHLSWRDGAGNPIGTATAVPQRVSRIAVADTGGTTPALVARTDTGPGAGIGVWPLDLVAEQEHEQVEQGPFDNFIVGDAGATGSDLIVSISQVPTGAFSTYMASRIRIVDPASGTMIWSGSIPANVDPANSDEFVALDLTRLTPEGHPVIALLGGADLVAADTHIVYLDGVTHAVLKRQALALPEARVATHLRMLDLDGDGVPEIVLVSAPSNSTTVGTRIHVLSSDTLAQLWMSPILADTFPATWVGVRPARPGSPPRLLLTLPSYGMWSVNPATHLVDFTVSGDFGAGAYLASSAGADRIALFDDTQSSLHVVDASSGVESDVLPFKRKYRALAADPNDEQRVLMVGENHLVAVRLGDHRHEGMSRELGLMVGYNGSLRVRSVAASSVAYAGDGVGVWALTLAPHEDALFADGFQSW